MIRKFIVQGLNGIKEPVICDFYEDINIFTGKNGCGKTTILKLLWYMMSGKLRLAFMEVKFDRAELYTDAFELQIDKSDTASCRIRYKSERISIEQTLPLQQMLDRGIGTAKMIHIKFEIDEFGMPTIFFPTFRRIEGGFGPKRNVHMPSPQVALKDALNDLSTALSTEHHKFVSSISTDDLVSLVTREYTKISEETNRLQQQQSDNIISIIKQRAHTAQSAEILLSQIQSDVEQLEKKRQRKLRPFSVLTELVDNIYEHKGISFASFVLGDLHHIVESDQLSAGEKQMLSFLCYNTFSNSQAIFIDEPELSLHPDWQRRLVPTLLKQHNNNQFIIATHSPFIYTKYPDREFMLDIDKGY